MHLPASLPPGDSFTPPSEQVEVLSMPTAVPWLKIAETIDCLRAVAPRTAVPIHRAMLSAPGQRVHYRLLELEPTADDGAGSGPR